MRAEPTSPPSPPTRPSPAPAAARTRRRALPWAVIALWIAVLAVAGVFAGRLGGVKHDENIDYLPASAQSTQVARIQQTMPGGGATDLVLVYRRAGGLTAADLTAVQRQTAALAAAYPVAGAAPHTVTAKDGRTAMVPVAIAQGAGKPEDVVERVRARLADGRPAGLTVLVGGPGGADADAKGVFASIDGTLLLSTAAVVALLLILTYRSPFLWLVPLAVVGVAAGTAMAITYGLVEGFGLTVSSMSSSVMTVLIFGAGTDYALLLISRYRDELRRTAEPYAAMAAALRKVGPAVLTSAATVVAGLLCLLAADLNSSRGLGPVGAVGILCSLAAMTTLLPAVLVLLGRRVFWPLIPAYGSPSRTGRGLYHRIGAVVTRRPVAVLAASLAAVGALALGLGNLPGALGQDDAFTTTPDSVAADRILHDAFPGRSTQAVTVVIPTAKAAAATDAVRTTAGVAGTAPGRSAGGWTEIAVYPSAIPDSAAEHGTIRRLRAVTAADHGLVGGASAQRMDTASTSSRDRALVVPLVLGAVFLLLAGLLRSLVAPLLLTAAMVAVWAAALGIGGLLFGPVLGLHGMDPGLPLLSFVFLVALGVDYGIFLMHRMREERLGGAEPRRATVTALEATGGVIASAGIVLAATFTVLASLPLVMMVEMGVVIALGVLLDTFVVRTLVVPAAAVLLGPRLWWPNRPE
ncbi:MMPL family transporter [Actinacidiphila acidipaludis]|uniref:MMPL family transporter n=1 Tax=Actinacidiphila acidipaludis TaxID=2873382 RepID=A0ABS7Q3J7_9ACTN|nr:MMPL family transporter [Streptomyces acidipaludis]MBY8877721.1 MMPL family transporter [Streptomyces acidipaludis]